MKHWKTVKATVLIDDVGWVRAVCFRDAKDTRVTLVGPLGTSLPLKQTINPPSKVRPAQIALERELEEYGYL